jgi:DNA mismatch repair ATPase MutS
MTQCGMFVPAVSLRASISRRLFTHFKREEDIQMKSGKFDEELSRLSKIIDDVVPNSMVLFNESLASTMEREGSEIAQQIVRALMKAQVRVFYVTHMFTLAHEFYQHANGQALFLRAERRDDGKRTFRLQEGAPLATSYGEDLYRQIFESSVTD